MLVPGRWSVYMVRCADGTLYTGISSNLLSRLECHNSGRGAKYTRQRRPVKLVYWESVVGHGDALRRERAIKRLSRSGKEELIKTCGVRGENPG